MAYAGKHAYITRTRTIPPGASRIFRPVGYLVAFMRVMLLGNGLLWADEIISF
jgi:hypothetical protein